jgi:hypothetical protein
MVPAAILAAALIALLAFAPLASATPDPVASGTTTLTLSKGLTKKLKKAKIKMHAIKPAKVSAKKAVFTVTGGSVDPTSGAGTLTHSGGIKFKSGHKSVNVTAIEINTSTRSVMAKVRGKRMKLAVLAGTSFSREGFGANLAAKSLKLTGPAAKSLNKYLAPKPKKHKHKKKGKKGTASSSKAKKKHKKKAKGAFKANMVLGSSASTEQPSTVAVLPGNTMTLATNGETIGKLKDVGVLLPVTAPTTEPSEGTFNFPISGGTISPIGAAGTVESSGGLQLLQKLPKNPEETEFLETEITLGNVWCDLGARTLTVEVVAKSNASEKLNLGNLGRSSIADVTIPGVSADPAGHTVSVSNAPAALQPIAAEVLEGFVLVYQAWYQAVAEAEGAPEAAAKELAEAQVKDDHITAGAPLGTVSFTAQTQ